MLKNFFETITEVSNLFLPEILLAVCFFEESVLLEVEANERLLDEEEFPLPETDLFPVGALGAAAAEEGATVAGVAETGTAVVVATLVGTSAVGIVEIGEAVV